MHLKIVETAKGGLEKKVEIMEAMIIQIFAHECAASTALERILRSSLSLTQRIQFMRDLLDLGVVNAVSKLRCLTESRTESSLRAQWDKQVDRGIRWKERCRDNQMKEERSGLKSEGSPQADLTLKDSTRKTAEEEGSVIRKRTKERTLSNQVHQALQTEELLSSSQYIQPGDSIVTNPISFRSGEQLRWQPMRQPKGLPVQASQTSLRQSSCSYEFDFSKPEQEGDCRCRKEMRRISPLQQNYLLRKIKQRCSKSRSCSPAQPLLLQSTQARQTEKRFELQKKWRGVLGEQIIRKKYKKCGWK